MFRSTAGALKILQNASRAKAFSTESSVRTDVALLKQELAETRRDILELQKIVQKNERSHLFSRAIIFGVVGSVATTAFIESFRTNINNSQSNYPVNEDTRRSVFGK
jgi:hypothetical protein